MLLEVSLILHAENYSFQLQLHACSCFQQAKQNNINNNKNMHATIL